MKFFISLVLTLFCACFVCAQEKELPQAEIQQLYMDYFHSQIDEVKGMSPSEKQELYDCVDSLIKKYQIIPNRGNNTLRKFEFFKRSIPIERLFSDHKKFAKYSAEQKKMYVEVIHKTIDFTTQLCLSKKLVDEGKNKTMDAALMNFEKSMDKALMKMLKRDKNLNTDIQRSKKWISEGRKSVSLGMLMWLTDTSYAKIKWKQLNHVDFSFFEKNRKLLMPTTPFSFMFLFDARIGLDMSKIQDQTHAKNAQNMGLTLPEYMKKIQDIQQLRNKINKNNAM